MASTKPTTESGKPIQNSASSEIPKESFRKRSTYSLGIDLGYSSVNVSLINETGQIALNKYLLHKGKIQETLTKVLADISIAYNTDNITTGAVTGSEHRLITSHGCIKQVKDVPALVEGAQAIQGDISSIIEIGGESAKYITGFTNTDRSGIQISMNSNCSAGTGSFLEDQVSRLNLTIEDYASYAARATSIPRIAGRCSVFAKTDIIHLQQDGVPVEDILQGLAYALIRNYRSAVIKKLPLERPILLAGGVGKNTEIARIIEDVLDLGPDELVVPEYCGNVNAIGAALIAQRENMQISFDTVRINSGKPAIPSDSEKEDVPLAALMSFGSGDSEGKHICSPFRPTNANTECYLGVDIGSTSTNLVLMNKDCEIISYRYLKTLGNPVAAVQKGLKDLQAEVGDKVTIIGAGTTGSGRYMIGKMIGADVIKDEITAQATAATAIDNTVDTIFEIGGQDSKYISMNNGVVTDFQMNKICAAGTGSFIEEQSKKFNIPITEFGDIAIASQNPVNLGERCTVFIETSIAAHLARGTQIDDIASGLCYSIAKNYLNRVVAQKPIGDKIFLQGGLAYNQGVINAFRSLTGKKVTVPPFFSVTGAYGVAILASEEMGENKTQFRGFEPDLSTLSVQEAEDESVKTAQESPFNSSVNETIFEGYDGSVDESKKTVGIPRALFTYGMYPMFNAFFRDLGFNVIMSEPSNEETIRLGQEYSLDETCYPVKLINGHVAELVEKKVDYIFFPDLYTVPHPGSHTRQDYGCPYMQLAFKMVNRAMELDKKGIVLLAPTIGFSLGEEFSMNSFIELGRKLGKNAEETKKALKIGMGAFMAFEDRIQKSGKEIMENLSSDEKVFVLISKTYGVADPLLNLGIPDRLADLGYKTIPFYNLPESDISQEHPNMYWPFGQHILEAAQIVKEHPNLYAIFLTHHGCGPDTVFSHYFREIMDGKPYLNIEVDEHSSGVGVITRLEAFVNSLRTVPTVKAEDMADYSKKMIHTPVDISTTLNGLHEDTTLYLPNISPYADIMSTCLKQTGIDAKPLPQSDSASVEAGRKYTMTSEYFSMTTLAGDVARLIESPGIRKNKPALLIPQYEGAEVDGQYNRFIRTILDEENNGEIAMLSPYLEDILASDGELFENIFFTMLAGDIVRAAPPNTRMMYQDLINERIRTSDPDIKYLEELADTVRLVQTTRTYGKTICAIGEPLILFNDYTTNHTFRRIEERGHRVVYAPLSEYMWMLWRDYIEQISGEDACIAKQRLQRLEDYISKIHTKLGEFSPFERNLNTLAENADATTGYYAGAFGRYRGAKLLGDGPNVDGAITVASMYENTGIALGILHPAFADVGTPPVLNLTFDGTMNENDETKVESFLLYL